MTFEGRQRLPADVKAHDPDVGQPSAEGLSGKTFAAAHIDDQRMWVVGLGEGLLNQRGYLIVEAGEQPLLDSIAARVLLQVAGEGWGSCVARRLVPRSRAGCGHSIARSDHRRRAGVRCRSGCRSTNAAGSSGSITS